ncbi:YceI family protein [Nonomuraea sp. NPDC050536]|uniref:YceI family protein n=1 Tax=Nonomuraea sp. NPDC050536 TaxID=3364366 RepID=UPI0037C4FC3B
MTPQLGRYKIDSGSITFRTRHLFGLAPVRGTFAIRSGIVDVAEPLADSRVEVEIDAGSFHTGNDQRDASVRSARLLDTDRFPVMTFRADGSLEGTLTVRGVTRPVALTVERSKVESGSFTVVATTRVDRTEFGVTAYRGTAGRYLDIRVEVTCVRS